MLFIANTIANCTIKPDITKQYLSNYIIFIIGREIVNRATTIVLNTAHCTMNRENCLIANISISIGFTQNLRSTMTYFYKKMDITVRTNPL